MAKKKSKDKGPEARFVIDNTKSFKIIFDIMKNVFDDVRLQFDEDGIKIRALSGDHASMILIDLTPSYFHEIKLNAEFGFNISSSDMTKILARATKNDSIELNYSSKDENILRISLLKNLRKRTFKMKKKDVIIKPVDLDGVIKNITDVQTATVTIDHEYFEEIIKDAAIVQEEISFTVQPEKKIIGIDVEGDTGDYTVDLNINEPYILDHELKDESHATYMVSNIENILKMIPVINHVKLQFTDENPILITGEIVEGMTEKLAVEKYPTIRGAFAPVVKGDDEEIGVEFEDDSLDDEPFEVDEEFKSLESGE